MQQILQTLNLQGNSLTSLEDLVGLDKLKTLNVASNNLNDVTKIQAFLTSVPSLIELDMRNNPVVQDYKNSNRILASAHNISEYCFLFILKMDITLFKSYILGGKRWIC